MALGQRDLLTGQALSPLKTWSSIAGRPHPLLVSTRTIVQARRTVYHFPCPHRPKGKKRRRCVGEVPPDTPSFGRAPCRDSRFHPPLLRLFGFPSCNPHPTFVTLTAEAVMVSSAPMASAPTNLGDASEPAGETMNTYSGDPLPQALGNPSIPSAHEVLLP
jgi:hypothetical protein